MSNRSSIWRVMAQKCLVQSKSFPRFRVGNSDTSRAVPGCSPSRWDQAIEDVVERDFGTVGNFNLTRFNQPLRFPESCGVDQDDVLLFRTISATPRTMVNNRLRIVVS